VSEDVAQINLSAIEVYRSNQAVFVPADVENDQVTYFIGRWECGAQFIETTKLTIAYNLIPPGKRTLAVGMFFPELT